MDIRIVSVIERPKTHLFVIRDDSGTTYATRNVWLASLADEYRKARTPVVLDASSGWFYKELHDIRPDTHAEVTA